MTFFILEAGVNHGGSLQDAINLVHAAARTGAGAVKFQTYTAERLAAPHSPSYWDLEEEPTTSQIELFKKYDAFTTLDYFRLAEESANNNIEFMTTCFDEYWVSELDPILKKYKVASADITNFQLLRAVARTGKPIYLSTGAATLLEIKDAIKEIQKYSSASIILMHCVLNYPTNSKNANLSRITILKQKFSDFEIGYSDHTKPEFSRIAIASARALGATVFEKHFTLDKSLKGNDHYHAYDEFDVQQTVKDLHLLDDALHFEEPKFIEIQQDARKYARRGLYLKRDVLEGETVLETDLIPLRPIAHGSLTSEKIFEILGKKYNRDLLKLQPLMENDLI